MEELFELLDGLIIVNYPPPFQADKWKLMWEKILNVFLWCPQIYLSHPNALTRVKHPPGLFKVVPKAKFHGRCGS